jgi:hypothetical protein
MAAVADIVAADTAVAGTVPADTAVAGTAVADTAVAGTAVAAPVPVVPALPYSPVPYFLSALPDLSAGSHTLLPLPVVFRILYKILPFLFLLFAFVLRNLWVF